MSRIGKQPIKLPDGVAIEISGQKVKVSGPKGALERLVHPNITPKLEGGAVIMSAKDPEDKKDKSLWGLERSLVANLVKGVTLGYEKKLEIQGIGFRAETSGNILKLHAGFTNPVNFEIPEGISVLVEKNIITVSGIDKQLVGNFTASIRAVKPPEPYKGKGIRYVGEVVRRKAGKAVAGGTPA